MPVSAAVHLSKIWLGSAMTSLILQNGKVKIVYMYKKMKEKFVGRKRKAKIVYN